jgi:hypothetical protein
VKRKTYPNLAFGMGSTEGKKKHALDCLRTTKQKPQGLPCGMSHIPVIIARRFLRQMLLFKPVGHATGQAQTSYQLGFFHVLAFTGRNPFSFL